MQREYDNKNRVVFVMNEEGWGFKYEYDDEWDSEIPAHCIEYLNGKVVYERHYDNVTTGG